MTHPEAASPAQRKVECRPRELQDGLNHYVFHPLARRLAIVLTGTPITPNMVSLAGGILVVGAGMAYAQESWPLAALAGLALHLTWHVLDGADGDLARLTGRSSPRGELVDGICDYASHAVLYLILGSMLQQQIGPVAWFVAASAGASRVVQANHYEVQRRQYQWWFYGVPWLRATRAGTEIVRTGGFLAAAYLTLARMLAPRADEVDAAMSQAGGDPGRLQRARALVRQHAAPILRSIRLLGANGRTVALGASMLAGSPVYFFVYEAVILNLVLLGSLRVCRASTARLLADLDHAEASTRR